VLLLHEVHTVAGGREEELEAAYRDELMPALAGSEGSRLLWCLRVAHGSGPAYTIVTITAWPFPGGLSRYLAKAATLYAEQTLTSQKKEGTGIIELEAAFQPAWGSHQTNEVVLWQRVVNHKALLWMLANDLPPAATAPGTWMHDALELRDRWQSRLLRSASWSPLY